jgi:hypothetical protein
VNENDKQETIPHVDSRDCTASAICGLHGRFFAGPAGYAVLWHVRLHSGKSESRLLQGDDFNGNT